MHLQKIAVLKVHIAVSCRQLQEDFRAQESSVLSQERWLKHEFASLIVTVKLLLPMKRKQTLRDSGM